MALLARRKNPAFLPFEISRRFAPDDTMVGRRPSALSGLRLLEVFGVGNRGVSHVISPELV
jgi:hypothetical protein